MNPAPALDPSAARAAAAELYAAARPAVSMAAMTSAQLVEFINDCEGIGRSVQAARTLAIARLAATEHVVREDGCVEEVSQGLGYRRLDAPDLVSEALGVSAQGAGSLVDEAVLLTCKLPALVDAMGAGRVDAYRAGIIAEELREAPHAVCDAVLARLDRSLHHPGGVLRRRTRRALEIVDPDSLVTRASRARSEVGLRMVANDDSTDTWTAILPTEQSRQAWAGIEPLAKQLRDSEGITLDQARAQAMTQLILGSCSGTFHLHLAVRAEDFAARFTEQSPGSTPPAADGPVVVTGMGTAGTTTVPGGWLGQVVAGQHGRVEVDAIGCDPATGGFTTDPVPVPVPAPGTAAPAQQPRRAAKLSTDAYQPTPAIRAFVKARDQHCRFPGCTASAYFTDLDHVRPWPAGPTHPGNLACLCRRHHRVKQRPGWTVRLNPDGSMDWTDPTERTRTTYPVDHLGATVPGTSDAVSATISSDAEPASTTAFGDPVWTGDYRDPGAYTGGVALWLHCERDLTDRFLAIDEWQSLSLADRYPHIPPALRILHDEASWANEWRDGEPEPQPSKIVWLAC